MKSFFIFTVCYIFNVLKLLLHDVLHFFTPKLLKKMENKKTPMLAYNWN